MTNCVSKKYLDSQLEKLVDYYSYQITRRIIYNHDKTNFKSNLGKIFDLNANIFNFENEKMFDFFDNIYDSDYNLVGFKDFFGTVMLN